MTILPVYGLGWFLTRVHQRWRSEDFYMRNLVRVAKREDFGGEIRVKVSGKDRVFDKNNANEFFPLLAMKLGVEMRKEIAGEVTLVPIPSSDGVVGGPTTFRTAEFAGYVARGLGKNASVSPIIRWVGPGEPTHKTTGPRHPSDHIDALRLVAKPEASRVVFIDDVFTSGSQMIACHWLMSEAGHEVVCGGVVARTTHEQRTPMREWIRQDLDIIERQQFDWDDEF